MDNRKIRAIRIRQIEKSIELELYAGIGISLLMAGIALLLL